ncbi:MAG TPA: hypothetical protein VFL59_05930 [Candidatus Nanopelagicales bacterium]|nr:hypothetical protein [Candidatus Nanopelagicales bacterium]
MTTKDDFTAEDWEKVAALPGLVLAGAAWADGKMMPAMRELVAGGEVLTAAANGQPEGSVVRDIFAGAAQSKPDLGDAKPASTEDAVTLMTGRIQEAFAILSATATPDEVAAVRTTLEGTATAVVERLGSGFWGSGSDKVSEGERAFLDRLAAVLETGEVPAAPVPEAPAAE